MLKKTQMESLITICLCVVFVAGTAMGDWDLCDSNKMHFPQLPDEDGWDVEFSLWIPQLADDWQCTQSGGVDDIHLWYSWEDDLIGVIDKVQVSIWSDDPNGTYSKPGTMLWGFRDFFPDDFTTRHWGTGDQGWYDPVNGESEPSNHVNTYQLNIVDINEPFIQEEGEIYWLSVCFWMGDESHHAGWKTADVNLYPCSYTGEHFMDDAVYFKMDSWYELKDPVTYDSLDLSFVITPEPATIALLGLGTLTLLRKRRA